MLITLTDEYTKGPMARAVPGAWYDRDHKAWVLKDPTPRGAAVALKLFPALAVRYPELPELRAQLGQEIRPFENAERFDQPIEADRVRESLAYEGHDLYDFQAIDAGYLAAVLDMHGGAYLGHERGLGKTLSSCAIIDELDCKRVLVVCPNTSKRAVWEPELRRFLPDWEPVVIRNAKAQRDRDLGYLRQLIANDERVVFVVHYEALAVIGEQVWKKLCQWDLIVADEVHRIANPKTKMARALKKIPATRKLAMSGTIIANHAEELFSPLQWLFPDRYRSRWRDWNDRFLDYVDSGYSRVCVGVKLERITEMRDELGRFMCYRRKEDCLDLPERTEETRFVELSPAQRKAYDSLVEEYFAALPDGTSIKATDGLALLTRLRQVATGLDVFDGELRDSSKQDLCCEMIEDNPDEAFVVFSWFKAAAYSLAERLDGMGIVNFVVTGNVKHDDRADYIRRFQGGEGRVFIGTLSTLSESVTLHRASSAVFLDRSWNPSHNIQAADRIHRIGQDRPVTITQIVAKNTVDELRVLPVIQDKEQLRSLILGGSRR